MLWIKRELTTYFQINEINAHLIHSIKRLFKQL